MVTRSCQGRPGQIAFEAAGAGPAGAAGEKVPPGQLFLACRGWVCYREGDQLTALTVENMAEVVRLHAFRRRQAAARGFRTWPRDYGDELDENTRISDLSNGILAFLITPGERHIFSIYNLVMEVRGLGAGRAFFDLEAAKKMEVVDISIYLLDLLRFECMRRLGWTEGVPESRGSIVGLVERYTSGAESGRPSVPVLAPSHSRFEEYVQLAPVDRERYVRRLIPEAITTFKRRQQDGG